jgi:hypothetical protein
MLVESSALHQLHGVEHAAIGQSTDVMHRDDAGMLQLGNDFRLAQQTRAQLSRGVHDSDYLESDLPAQSSVLDAEDSTHAARAQFVEHHITSAAEVWHIGSRAETMEGLI